MASAAPETNLFRDREMSFCTLIKTLSPHISLELEQMQVRFSGSNVTF
ncbi:hypothetical protein IMCC12053_26 [Celeribacter marinus]|uniref:Uncharacterized protein n=1 Tax=Celeribacter marinus TaxID=1397108 RepID=A0A0N9ZL62_9RHOB|nr:hypothetical protein IMCC12053_26 [Celeribacter marinus]